MLNYKNRLVFTGGSGRFAGSFKAQEVKWRQDQIKKSVLNTDEVEEKLANFTKISNSTSDSIKNDFAPAYIESLIESTTENLKKSTSSIEQQQLNQDMIVKSLSEINQFLNTNINTNKIVADEIKILSKTIANIKRDK